MIVEFFFSFLMYRLKMSSFWFLPRPMMSLTGLPSLPVVSTVSSTSRMLRIRSVPTLRAFCSMIEWLLTTLMLMSSLMMFSEEDLMANLMSK